METTPMLLDTRSPPPTETSTPSQAPSRHTPIQSGKPDSSPVDVRSQDGAFRRAGPGRKPRACIECKKQKMKCEVFPGDTKCKNCLRRTADCIFQKVGRSDSLADRESPKVISSKYEAKIDSMSAEIKAMRASLDTLINQGAQITTPHPTAQKDMVRFHETPTISESSPAGTNFGTREEDNTHMAMTRENSLEPGATDDSPAHGSVTVEEPMGSLYEVTRLRNIRSSRSKMTRAPQHQPGQVHDFISRGVISEAEAGDLYRGFQTSLNHYLWVGLEQTHPSFESVRQSSELLTATILTVTALHIPTSAETFDKCYREFLMLISSSMFSRYHSIDDVRGLCIAAFWLSEVSWKLSGHAIRIATELNIHQSFSKALEGDRQHFLRARLWYQLYVCDHHFSIVYGRPPMIAESYQIREHEQFLASPFADPLDRRVLSQVALMQIMTRIYDRFSEQRLPAPSHNGIGGGKNSNTSQMLRDPQDFIDMRNFNLEIDQWRMRWHSRQENNQFIGSFPPKGIILYSYFAKVQLNSLAIRGLSLSPPTTSSYAPTSSPYPVATVHLSTERKEFANAALSAAASILTFVLEEEDMRRALVGTPLYVHTMIAFASVFLVKVATEWKGRIVGLNVEVEYVSGLLGRMIELLKGARTSDRHVLRHIAVGLEKMMGKLGMGIVGQQHDNMGGSGALGQGRGDTYGHGHIGGGGGGCEGYGVRASSSSGLMTTAGSGDSGQWGEGEGVYHPGGDMDGGGGRQQQQNNFMDSFSVMNDSLIYEAFGTDSANDVYNMLNTHFSQ